MDPITTAAGKTFLELYGDVAFGVLAVCLLIVVITRAALTVWDRVIKPMMDASQEQALAMEKATANAVALSIALQQATRDLKDHNGDGEEFAKVMKTLIQEVRTLIEAVRQERADIIGKTFKPRKEGGA